MRNSVCFFVFCKSPSSSVLNLLVSVFELRARIVVFQSSLSLKPGVCSDKSDGPQCDEE